MIELVPSILSADFTRLGEQVRAVEEAGARRIQIDVMDGHFVPNITMGPMVVEAVRRCTNATLETHLMITNPQEYIETFAKAGADLIIVHYEVCPHLHSVIQQIRKAGKQVGVALNPSTPVFMLEDMISLTRPGPGDDNQSRFWRPGTDTGNAAKDHEGPTDDHRAWLEL